MLNKIRETKAFTLIEIITVVFIMAISMLFIIGVYTQVDDEKQITEQAPPSTQPKINEQGDLNKL